MEYGTRPLQVPRVVATLGRNDCALRESETYSLPACLVRLLAWILSQVGTRLALCNVLTGSLPPRQAVVKKCLTLFLS